MKLDQLIVSYPKLFSSSFYFECGEGWYDLLDHLCGLIQNHVTHVGLDQVEVTQVKEKFGELRFYYMGGDEYIDGAVVLAMNLSTHICDICGNPGKLMGKGWMRTVCDEHSN